MNEVAVHWALALAAVLFSLGLLGVMFRRNLIFILLSLEIMLNAAALAFVAAGAKWGQPDGQVVFLFVLTMAASEVAVGLAITLAVSRRLGTLSTASMKELKG